MRADQRLKPPKTFMLNLGETARELRERAGLSQIDSAKRLGITQVHLSNIENNKARPSPDLAAKYRDVFGADLYVYAFCTRGDLQCMPKGVRDASTKLAVVWRAELDKRLGPIDK
jgi:transcriptional regulator with XRE-family HTH domain